MTATQGITPPNSYAKKPFYKKWWFWALVVLVIIIAAIGGNDNADKDATGAASDQESAQSNDSDALAADDTAASNAGDADVTTDEVQDDPEPEQKPEPEPEPESNFPEFDKFEFSGNGDDVITDVGLAYPAVVVFSCETCTGNFSVKTDGGISDLLPVNTIGSYSGMVVMNMDEDGIDQFIVSADAPWKIILEDLNSLEEFDSETSGKGDSAFIYTGSSTAATLSHDGDSNFTVYSHSSFMSLAVNEIGAYEGTVPVEAGVISIGADGNWTFKAK